MDKDHIHISALSSTRRVQEQDQGITSSSLDLAASRRQAKSAPTTPKKTRRTAASHENVPDLKASLERLKAKKMPDATQRNLRTAASASAIPSVRGQQFTVGSFSNGLIYLRYGTPPRLLRLRASSIRLAALINAQL